MNKSFKTVWNDALGAWVATPEHQAARGKRSGSVAKAVLASAVGLAATTGAFAAGFDGGDVSQGTPGTVNGVAIGGGSSANSNFGAAFGPGAAATGVGDVAVGADAKVNSGAPNGDGGVLGSTAVGSNAHALAASATSLGGQANASGTQSTAVGSHAQAAGSGSFAGAYGARAAGAAAVAIGAGSTASGEGNVALGNLAAATGSYNSIAIGEQVKSGADDSVSIGSQIDSKAINSIALGSNGLKLDANSQGSALIAPNGGAVVDSSHSLVFNPYGTGGTADAANATTSNSNDSINLSGIVANAPGAVAVGSNSSITAANGVAIGARASTTAAGSVALGSNSIADRANTVSVGAAGSERQIVNVARGTAATDAVNVTQLQDVTTLLGGGAKIKADGTVQAPSYAVTGAAQPLQTVSAAITALDASIQNRVAYDSPSHDKVTLGGATASAPVALTNVKAAALSDTSTDAVNGSQLNTTNKNVTSLQSFADNINNGGGIKYFHTNSKLADSTATGTDSVAIGGAANASADNAVALGSNSVANRANTVSVGAAGSERQIVNVARGTAATDAVNVTQLQDVTTLLGGGAKIKADGTVQAPSYAVTGAAQPLQTVSAAITALDASIQNRVAYDSAAHDKVTLGGATASAPVALTNVKAAALSDTSTDAVNGSQLNTTNKNVTSLQSFADNINDGGGIKYFHANSKLADSTATGTDSVAIGGAANASANNAVALGSNSVANRANTVSVGATGSERQIVNVARGTSDTDAVNVAQLKNGGMMVDTNGNVTNNFVSYDDSAKQKISLGGTGASKSVSITNLAAGNLSDTSTDAVNGSQLTATNKNVTALQSFADNINNGGGIKYFHTNSKLADSTATGTDSVAIGGAANASADNAVALGSNSIADRANTLSVGAAGSERQIVNVARGTSDTDAVNVAQLKNGGMMVDTDGNVTNNFVSYDDSAKQKITLGGAGASSAVSITNLKAGDLSATSTDAVNGSQLYATNQTVAGLSGFVNNVNNGGGIKYFHTNSTLADSTATGKNAVAIGGAAKASADNAIALGSNSIADRANTVSVGAAGSERQIANVAAGTSATDAVNVAQLKSVASSVNALDSSAVKYDTNADGSSNYASVTLGGGKAANGTTLHNVAAGASNTDAVNVAQLNDAVGRVTNIANNAYNPLFSADGSRDIDAATSSGTRSTAAGAKAVASGANSVATGADSVASGKGSVAVGSSATAKADNAVALGANSVADRANTVSVGSSAANGQRQIVNVAAGTSGTDAVNLDQMNRSVNTGVKQANNYTDALRRDVNSSLAKTNNHLESVGAMSSAMALMTGSAAAIVDKDNRFAAGVGVYRDKSALAVGFQRRFMRDAVMTLGVSTTGEETTGGAGVAFGF